METFSELFKDLKWNRNDKGFYPGNIFSTFLPNVKAFRATLSSAQHLELEPDFQKSSAPDMHPMCWSLLKFWQLLRCINGCWGLLKTLAFEEEWSSIFSTCGVKFSLYEIFSSSATLLQTREWHWIMLVCNQEAEKQICCGVAVGIVVCLFCYCSWIVLTLPSSANNSLTAVLKLMCQSYIFVNNFFF